MRGLLICSPHIEKILRGEKIWEIRGSRTSVRGQIALIRSGSGEVVGTCEIVDCIGPLNDQELRGNAPKAGLRRAEAVSRYKRSYAWVIAKARPLKRPVPYTHPSGAVIWVILGPRTARAVSDAPRARI